MESRAGRGPTVECERCPAWLTQESLDSLVGLLRETVANGGRFGVGGVMVAWMSFPRCLYVTNGCQSTTSSSPHVIVSMESIYSNLGIRLNENAITKLGFMCTNVTPAEQ